MFGEVFSGAPYSAVPDYWLAGSEPVNVLEFPAVITPEMSFDAVVSQEIAFTFVLDPELDFTMSTPYDYLPHVGDKGTRIVCRVVTNAGAAVDITDAELVVKLKAQGGTTKELAGEVLDGEDGTMFATTDADTFDEAGNWEGQGFARIGDNEWNSNRFNFYVEDNL